MILASIIGPRDPCPLPLLVHNTYLSTNGGHARFVYIGRGSNVTTFVTRLYVHDMLMYTISVLMYFVYNTQL